MSSGPPASGRLEAPGPPGPPVDELSYTEASRELDEIVAFFEQREVDVDQLVARLERATAIVDELDRRLRRTRAQVEELVPRLQAASESRSTVPEGPSDREPEEEEMEAELEQADRLAEDLGRVGEAVVTPPPDQEPPGLF